DACAECGANRTSSIAKEVRKERERGKNQRHTGNNEPLPSLEDAVEPGDRWLMRFTVWDRLSLVLLRLVLGRDTSIRTLWIWIYAVRSSIGVIIGVFLLGCGVWYGDSTVLMAGTIFLVFAITGFALALVFVRKEPKTPCAEKPGESKPPLP